MLTSQKCFFSRNLHPKLKRILAKSLKMPHKISRTKYLGVEIDSNKPHAFDINSILGKVKSRTNAWSSRFVSQAGRVTLSSHSNLCHANPYPKQEGL